MSRNLEPDKKAGGRDVGGERECEYGEYEFT